MKMEKEGNLVECIPEEIWIEIFEIGLKRSLLYIKDLHSISLTCKLFNKLWNEDSIWSLLLALDSRPRFAYHETSHPEAYSSCNQSLYKYRLGRLTKSKFVYTQQKIQKNEDRMRDCSDRVKLVKFYNKRHPRKNPGMGNRRLEELSELLASGMGKGDQVIALCRRASFALGTLANAHSPCMPVDCSSSFHSLVGLEKKIEEVLSVMQDKASNYYRKDVFCILLHNQLENFKQLVVLTSRLVYLSSGSNPIETGGSREAENDYYSTDDDGDDDIHYDFFLDITDNDDTDDDDYDYDNIYFDEGEDEDDVHENEDEDDVDHDHNDASDDDHNDESEDEDENEIVDEDEGEDKIVDVDESVDEDVDEDEDDVDDDYGDDD